MCIFSIWTIIFLIFWIWFLKNPIKIHKSFTETLNLTSAVLVLLSLLGIFSAHHKQTEKNNEISSYSEAVSVKDSRVTEADPDIYYFVLDMYPGNSTLISYYDFNNEPFFDELRKRGFYIAEKSFSNYDKTRFSLPSSLNMDYLRVGGRNPEDLYSDYHGEFVQNNKVLRYLKSRGYFSVNIGFKNEAADANYYYSLTGEDSFSQYVFYESLLNRTLFKYLISLYMPGAAYAYRDSVEYQFRVITDIVRIQKKKYVFNHVISPHPPFVFGDNCQPIPFADALLNGLDGMYVGQISCVNQMTLQAIDKILQHNSDAVILLQGDHGPFFLDKVSEIFNPDRIRKHFMILNAYRIPLKFQEEQLYSSISPVNSFRAVFNSLFDEDFELLEDEAFVLQDLSFKKVTDLIYKNISDE